jgi:hypothetical protein
LNPTQVKVINLAFNELNKMNELNNSKDSLLELKEKRIEILKFQLDTRTDQLITVNKDHIRLEKSNKLLRFKVIIWKITTISCSIITYLIFK